MSGNSSLGIWGPYLSTWQTILPISSTHIGTTRLVNQRSWNHLDLGQKSASTCTSHLLWGGPCMKLTVSFSIHAAEHTRNKPRLFVSCFASEVLRSALRENGTAKMFFARFCTSS